MVALPYTTNSMNIVMMAIQHHVRGLQEPVLDYFENDLNAESHEHTRIMAVAMHPYLSGSPNGSSCPGNSSNPLHPGVGCWMGEQILTGSTPNGLPQAAQAKSGSKKTK